MSGGTDLPLLPIAWRACASCAETGAPQGTQPLNVYGVGMSSGPGAEKVTTNVRPSGRKPTSLGKPLADVDMSLVVPLPEGLDAVEGCESACLVRHEPR